MDPNKDAALLNAEITGSSHVTTTLTTTLQKSYEDKRSYQEKLETATGIDIFKYILLINVSALDGFVAQARLQANQSFNLSKIVAIFGFVIVLIAIIISIILTIIGDTNLNVAYLTGIAGVLTEFIAGVFFYLYSKTLSQINLFHDKLVEMQKIALNYISNEIIATQPSTLDK